MDQKAGRSMTSRIRQFFGALKSGGRTATNRTPPLKPFLSDQYKKMLAAYMPTTEDALWRIMEAKDRLHDLGWISGVHAPKTGEEVEVLQIGSTGIFKAYYEVHMNEFIWWDGDTSELGGQPFMYRPIEENEQGKENTPGR